MTQRDRARVERTEHLEAPLVVEFKQQHPRAALRVNVGGFCFGVAFGGVLCVLLLIDWAYAALAAGVLVVLFAGLLLRSEERSDAVDEFG